MLLRRMDAILGKTHLNDGRAYWEIPNMRISYFIVSCIIETLRFKMHRSSLDRRVIFRREFRLIMIVRLKPGHEWFGLESCMASYEGPGLLEGACGQAASRL